jgi:hypothetical protein
MSDTQIAQAAMQLTNNIFFQKFMFTHRRNLAECWLNGEFMNVNEREEAYKKAQALTDLLDAIHIAIDNGKIEKDRLKTVA